MQSASLVTSLWCFEYKNQSVKYSILRRQKTIYRCPIFFKMSNWSNVAGKAGAGAAIAGVSMTYYALMRRNIELERQHQLQLDTSSEAKGSRRRSEENIKSSSNLLAITSENEGDDFLDNSRKLKPASASDSALVNSAEESSPSVTTLTSHKVPPLENAVCMNEPRENEKETFQNKYIELLNSSCDYADGNMEALQVSNKNEIITAASSNFFENDQAADGVQGQGQLEKLTGKLHLPFSIPIPVAYCSGSGSGTVACEATPLIENGRQEKTSHHCDGGEEVLSSSYLRSGFEEVSIGDTPRLGSVVECPTPIVLSAQNVASGFPKISSNSPATHEQGDASKKIEGSCPGNTSAKRNNNTSPCPCDIQDQEQELVEPGIKKRGLDESKINAIFINKDTLLRTGDEDSSSGIEQTECSSEIDRIRYRNRIRKRPRVHTEIKGPRTIADVEVEATNPSLNNGSAPPSPSASAIPTAATSFTNAHGDIPISSWTVWPFNIFPAKYAPLVLIFLVILSWLLCGLISYGIINTVYYANQWEPLQFNLKSLISIFTNNEKVLNSLDEIDQSSAAHGDPPSMCSSSCRESDGNGEKTGWRSWHW